MLIEMRIHKQDFHWRCTLISTEGQWAVDHDTPGLSLLWMLKWAQENEINCHGWEVINPPPILDKICNSMMEGHVMRIAYNMTNGYWLAMSGGISDGEFIGTRHGAGKASAYHALIGHAKSNFKNEQAQARALYTYSSSQ